MNISHSLLLAKQGLQRSLLSASGILFLVFYGIIWYVFFSNAATEKLNSLGDPEAYSFMSLFAHSSTLDSLFVNNSPFLSVFYIVILFVTPGFVMWGAGDQTSKDISSKYMRFLMPRTGRFEIYIGRFLGAVAFTFIIQISICLIALIIALSISHTDQNVVMYSLRIMIGIMAYTVAFVAFMSFLTALTGSTAIAVLTAITSYAVLITISDLLSKRFPYLEVVGWLVPSALKEHILVGNTQQYLIAIGGLFIYSAVFLVLGWLVFRSRDI